MPYYLTVIDFMILQSDNQIIQYLNMFDKNKSINVYWL